MRVRVFCLRTAPHSSVQFGMEEFYSYIEKNSTKKTKQEKNTTQQKKINNYVQL